MKYDTTLLETRCRGLISALGNRLAWKWDPRFETILAEFDIGQQEEIQSLLETQMNRSWHPQNTQNAPEIIHVLIDYFGGINPGQRLFTSDPALDGLLLCAWWPWGNGKTVSIRLAVFADSLSDEENEELTRIFRSWFKV